jgi:hypothetical protein
MLVAAVVLIAEAQELMHYPEVEDWLLPVQVMPAALSDSMTQHTERDDGRRLHAHALTAKSLYALRLARHDPNCPARRAAK